MARIERVGNVFFRVREADIEQTATFYEQVLGLPLKLRDGTRWIAFDCAGVTLALEGAATSSGPGGATVSLRVDDVDGFVADLRGRGATVTDPQDGPHERRATVTDPAGNTLVLYAPLRR